LLNFLVRKILYGFLVMLGVTVIVFFLFQGFGDPARLILGQTGDAETLKNIRKELYLDQPKGKQFLYYLRDISPVSIHTEAEIREKQLKGFFIGGNRKLAIKIPYLRRSYQSKREVLDVLTDALPGTLVLAGAAMIFATIAGILLGILAAVKKGTWWDSAAIFSSVVGISAPSFFMGILIAWLFGFAWSTWTGLHMTGSMFETDAFTGRRIELQNLILPAFTLGIRPLAIIAQLTRSSMLDVLGQD